MTKSGGFAIRRGCTATVAARNQRFGGPLLEPLDESRKRDRARRLIAGAEEMDMVRQDDISAYTPTVSVASGRPFPDEYRHDVGIGEKLYAIVSARRDEIDRRLDPDGVKSSQIIALRHGDILLSRTVKHVLRIEQGAVVHSFFPWARMRPPCRRDR